MSDTSDSDSPSEPEGEKIQHYIADLKDYPSRTTSFRIKGVKGEIPEESEVLRQVNSGEADLLSTEIEAAGEDYIVEEVYEEDPPEKLPESVPGAHEWNSWIERTYLEDEEEST